MTETVAALPYGNLGVTVVSGPGTGYGTLVLPCTMRSGTRDGFAREVELESVVGSSTLTSTLVLTTGTDDEISKPRMIQIYYSQ
jgi:hypothetical protein